MDVLYLTAPKNTIRGKIKLPFSKSISNRILIINSLSTTPIRIKNLSDASDTVVLKKALDNVSNVVNINIGDSGSAMRFLTAFLANTPGEFSLSGTSRMKQRPIGDLADALRHLGANIEYLEQEGYPPLKIFGKKLKGGTVEINAGISSQFISALLMVGPAMEKGLKVRLIGDVVSLPYINMTMDIMKRCNIDIDYHSNEIIVKKGEYHCDRFTIEPDWSAASYYYSILALSEAGKLFLPGLSENSIQGDSIIRSWFEQLGIESNFSRQGLYIKKTQKTLPKQIDINFKNNPDLAQTMAVCIAGKGINAKFAGLQSLKIKETDRILALQNELKKVGYLLNETVDEQWILEKSGLNTKSDVIVFETYKDHRMALSFSALSCILEKVGIQNPEVVKKSHPEFWKNLQSIGFNASLIQEDQQKF